jgi:hypothetical protein
LRGETEITSEKVESIRSAARWTSWAICLIMLNYIFVQHDMNEQESYFSFFHRSERIIVGGICIVQLLLTVIFFGLWIKMRLPLCRLKLQKEAGDAPVLLPVEF